MPTWLALAGICAALGSMLVPAFLRGYRHYNVHVRQQVLGAQLLSGTVSSRFLGVVLLDMQDGRSFVPSALDAACTSVENAGARVIYAGRAIKVGVESKQAELEEVKGDAVEAVLVIEFGDGTIDDTAGKKLLKKWRTSDALKKSDMRVMAAQGFRRNDILNQALSLGLTTLRGVMEIFGLSKAYHLHKLATSNDSEEKMIEFIKRYQAAVKRVGASKKDGIFIWNWLKRGSAKQQAADSEYGLQMMKMLAIHGGGIMEYGNPVTVDGEFDTIAAVYYPGVAFFERLLSSEWMRKTVKGKQPGDSVAVITTPFKRKSPARSWVVYEE